LITIQEKYANYQRIQSRSLKSMGLMFHLYTLLEYFQTMISYAMSFKRNLR